MRTCGKCEHWVKLSGFGGKGICEALDIGWVPSDSREAVGCGSFSKPKYKRIKTHQRERYES